MDANDTLLKIEARAGDIRALVERLEFDASFDKCGPLYYQLKRMISYHDEAMLVANRFEITSKARKRFGQTYPAQPSGMFAEIGKNNEGKTTIHLTGEYCGKVVDIKFAEGDTVEYDSYNLRYLGVIEKITEKRITVQPRYGAARKSMDLYSFAWRNHNFNLEQAVEENHQTSMFI